MELSLQTRTGTHGEKTIWDELAPIYRQAFPHGTKPAWLLRRIKWLAEIKGFHWQSLWRRRQERLERQAQRTGGGRS